MMSRAMAARSGSTSRAWRLKNPRHTAAFVPGGSVSWQVMYPSLARHCATIWSRLPGRRCIRLPGLKMQVSHGRRSTRKRLVTVSNTFLPTGGLTPLPGAGVAGVSASVALRTAAPAAVRRGWGQRGCGSAVGHTPNPGQPVRALAAAITRSRRPSSPPTSVSVVSVASVTAPSSVSAERVASKGVGLLPVYILHHVPCQELHGL